MSARASRAALLVGLLAVALGSGAAVAQEAIGVQGGGDPLQAPVVREGLYVDTIREPETLFYALDARAGQTVTVVAVVRGQPGGPPSDSTRLRAQIYDAQRQPVAEADERFTGQADAQVPVEAAVLPEVSAGSGNAYLAITVADPGGGVPLAGFAYALEFSVAITGEASAPAASGTASAPAATGTPSGPAETGTATVPPTVSPTTPPQATEPAPPAVVRDVFPVALVALALGGAAGFELSRRRR